ncbi:MAG TPA: Clp protease N-terminal domain-containing protein [Pirellulales bacterium]|jgi:ATP-dependent Clp protease ATP-binding subunit ClpC
MFHDFSEHAQGVMIKAAEEARRYCHAYVGTEHILLALVDPGSGIAADVLRSLGIDEHAVRQEIESLVERGPFPVTAAELPLTPRAKLAIDFAQAQGRYMNLKTIPAEYLLLGLIREPDGVAGLALRTLGLNRDALCEQIVHIRLAQLQIVERAVRPVRASTSRKLKMREELLAHFTAIFDEENARLHDPNAALKKAAERFGDAAELSSELETALPIPERVGYFIERWLGWRAPESAAKFMLRSSAISFAILSLITLVATAAVWISGGKMPDGRTLMPALANLLLMPVAQFCTGVLYFKMRDSMFGVFGARKSSGRALSLAICIALFATGIGFGYFVLLRSYAVAVASLPIVAPCAVAVAAMFWLKARKQGPAEIAHTVWDCLPLEKPSIAQ